jgi:hypothetical protein
VTADVRKPSTGPQDANDLADRTCEIVHIPVNERSDCHIDRFVAHRDRCRVRAHNRNGSLGGHTKLFARDVKTDRAKAHCLKSP